MSLLAALSSRLLGSYPSRQVQLLSPLPSDECLYRLRRYTSARRGVRYLENRFAGASGPVFYGWVRENRIGVFFWQPGTRGQRGLNAARLTAVVEQAPQGGTTVTGTIGLQRSELGSLVVVPLLALAAVVVCAVTGNFGRLFLIAAVGVVAYIVLLAVNKYSGPARYERSSAAVLEAIAGLLEVSPVAEAAPEP